MYKQFAITLVVSVVISGIVALTLTPALCAVLLKPDQGESRNRAVRLVQPRASAGLTEGYVRSVGGVIARPSRWIAVLRRDAGAHRGARAPGAERVHSHRGQGLLRPGHPAARRRLAPAHRGSDPGGSRITCSKQPAVAYVVNFAGLSFVLGTNQTNSASMFVLLKPWDERTGEADQLDAVLQGTNGFLFSLSDAVAFGFNLPEIPGLGTTAGLEVNLQDRGVNDIRKFAGLVSEYTQQANAQPELQGVQSLMRVNVPQIYVRRGPGEGQVARGVAVGRLPDAADACCRRCTSTTSTCTAGPTGCSSRRSRGSGRSPEDIGRLYVRGPDGAMIPISSLVRTEFQGGPSLVQRFNGFTSALVTGQPKPGYSSGQMLGAVRPAGRLGSSSPGGWATPSAASRIQERAASGAGRRWSSCFGLVMVFLVLAAQYESWSIPFAVLFGIPFGAFGAFLGVWLRGHGERRLLPDRAAGGGGARGQERDPDRGVRQRAPGRRDAPSARPRSRRPASGSGRS